jgi:hypothetical protein
MHVRKTRKEAEKCGLDKGNYHYWMLNFKQSQSASEARQRKQSILRPDSNNGNRTIIRRPKPPPEPDVNVEIIRIPPPRPRMPNYEAWLYYSDKGFRTEILVQPRRIVLDTNCFVRKLHLVQLLLTMVVEPFYIPVSVILELKGLSKGGYRTKEKERYGSVHDAETKEILIQSYETADKCKTALTYIAEHMEYFRIVTSTARELRVKSPFVRIMDDYFDPSMNNDDRILDTCKYLEAKDLEARSLDSPRRIYRKTLLVTGDRILRIKTYTLDIPSRPLSSILFWYTCHQFPRIHSAMLKKSKEDSHKAYQRRQQIRTDRKRGNP